MQGALWKLGRRHEERRSKGSNWGQFVFGCLWQLNQPHMCMCVVFILQLLWHYWDQSVTLYLRMSKQRQGKGHPKTKWHRHKMDWEKGVAGILVLKKKKIERNHLIPGTPRITPNQISYNYLNLFIPLQIDRERTRWLGTTITPLLGPDVALIAGGNGGPLKRQQGLLSPSVSMGDDHITMRALCGVFLT